MKIITYFVLTLILINVFFLVGCNIESKSTPLEGEPQTDQAENEDTGIGDVFEDTEEVNPPPIPT